MASISHDKTTGRRTIQFVGPDGKRRSIRLGKVNKKQAETAKLFVEDLLTAKTTGTSPKPVTAEWVSGLPRTLRTRLERTGLILPEERSECPTLGEWLGTYIRGRRDVKAGTATFYGHTKRNLLDFFGQNRPLGAITPGDADEFRIHLATHEGLSDNTVRRRCRMAKQFFRAAVRKQVIAENPFGDIKAADRPNEQRFYFITREQAEAVLDACPDSEWRLIFALCRYGGLRCPSEVLALRWEDIDWERSRFTVHASKTEHHTDGGIRQVPIFPELYPYLYDRFEQAEPGETYVITRYRNTNANLRTQLARIVKRAALTPWPKLFQNMRSTRETELTQQFPVHVVCKWIGNSQLVAAKHYLQVTEEHFTQAAQNPVHFPVQQRAAHGRTDSQNERTDATEPCLCGAVREDATPYETTIPRGMGVTGLEPVTSSL